LIGTAVAMALFGREEVLHAQAQAAAAGAAAGELQEVVVSGIRYSMEQSLEQKKAAVATVDVITAEDIGKMPDKNVADALQRVPGVTISSAGANEGGFDEADRVSIRGTPPSYTQTLINGHFVASGDWFVLDQTGTVGRSVSYTLLPSELVSKVVVQKTSEADLIEGGIAGSVDIITRKPLDFQKPTTLEASVGAVYADLPSATSPQFSALGNWVNDARNFGVLIQLFSETRQLRRDGQENLGYDTIAPGSKIALADPNLSGVAYPHEMDVAFFEQKRQRNGGLVDVEFQPADNLTFDASGFYSKLNATNYNRSYVLWNTNFVQSGSGQAPNPGYTITNGTLTSATWSAVPGTTYGVYDQISRPDESSDSNFGNLDIKWAASDHLTFLGQVGVSTGHGKTPTQDVIETNAAVGAGAAYVLNGITSAANWNLGNTNVTTPQPGGVPVTLNWIFGDVNMDVLDKETWGKIDAQYNFEASSFKSLDFGVRFSDHQRHQWGAIGQRPGCGGVACPANIAPDDPANPYNPGNLPVGWQNFPTNFGNGLGGSFPTNVWYWTPAQLSAFNQEFTDRDPLGRHDWTADYGLEEKVTSAYLQANFVGSGWSGNLGLRAVRTDESVISNVSASATDPNAIVGSAFGPYVQQTTDNTYNNLLPSANLKIDINPQTIARFAVAETMARPDYSALAGSVQLFGAPVAPGAAGGSGSGGNPDLKPIKSTNLDAGLEWYFAPKSILSADVFYMDLKDYIGLGSVTRQYQTFNNNFPNGFAGDYIITVPTNANGRVQGAELEYQQLFFDHWGLNANYTYADGKQTSGVQPNADGSPGDDRLVGTSKDTFNFIGFYENSVFSARVAYNYRSSFFSGLDRSTAFTQAAIGTWSASLQYTVNENFSLSLDGLNLNNPTLKYYGLNEDQPRAFYKNGAQYYLTARFKL
jgi:iron complex outermembrane receptor protein